MNGDQFFQAIDKTLREGLWPSQKLALHDELVAALRGLTDAIGKNGHARLSYWEEMKAAWAVLAKVTP